MEWLFPSVVATMVGTLIMTATYLFLYHTDPQPFLKIWVYAWGLYAFRFACMLGYLSIDAAKPVLLIGNQLAALWSGIALLWGTYRFIGRSIPRSWTVFGLSVSVYIIVAGVASSSIVLLSLPIFLFLGWVYLWTGVIFFRQERFPSHLSKTVGIFFIVWGIHKADYPILRPLVWLAPWGYLMGAVLEISVALGMLMIYFQQAREQLRLSEAKFRNIFENAVEGFFQSTPEGKFVNVNSAFANMLGYVSPEELITSITDIETQYYSDPQDRRRYQIHVHDQGKVQNVEFKVKRKDGTTIWVSNSTRAVHDDNGNILLYEGTITDITARKQLERRLRRQQYLFEKAQEIGRIGTWTIDGASGKLHWSTELYTIFQVEAGSNLTYERFLECVHPDDREDVNRAWQAALAGQPYDIEHRILAGGAVKWIREKAELHVDDAGALLGAVGFAQDVTDRKRAEIERLESTERFKTLYDNAPISYQSLDEKGCFLEVNRTWLNIMGYEKSDVVGRHFSNFLHPDWRDHFKTNFPRFKSIGEILGVEFEMIRKDGSSILVSFHGKIGKAADGTFKQTHCVFWDLTEQRQIKREKEEIEKRLNQMQKMESIGCLAGGIAHDFNNLLFPIVGMSEILMEDLPSGSPQYENAREIFKAGRRASELVKQILAFSRQADHKLIPLRIQQVLLEALKLCRSTIPADFDIVQEIFMGCGPVMADPTQLHQVVMNLMTNAYHAIEATGGAITVRLEETVLDAANFADASIKPGRYAALTVVDSGCGIDPGIIDRIFEPYFTTKKQGRGTGLGLSMVYGIVQQHRGHIRISSDVGRGTTVHIYFPLIKAARNDHEGKATEKNEGGAEKILLVDDEAPVIRLVTKILERLGYRVTAFTGSIEALNAFSEAPQAYDLVITDMTMPGMTGDRLAARLLAIREDIPVILCTGFSERIDPEKAKRLGIKGFLMKPAVKSDIALMVRNVLDGIGQLADR